MNPACFTMACGSKRILTRSQVVSVYIAVEALGAILQIFMADKLGRIHFMQTACILVTIGCVIQTAAVNVGMFLAGRVLAGIAVGSVVYSLLRFELPKRCL